MGVVGISIFNELNEHVHGRSDGDNTLIQKCVPLQADKNRKVCRNY